MVIESLSNKLIKHACALRQKKYREEYGQFLAEGVRFVLDACVFAPKLVQAIFLTPFCIISILEFLQKNRAITAKNSTESSMKQAVLAEFVSMGIAPEKVNFVTEAVIKKLCDAENPQQIAAVISKRDCAVKNDYMLFLDRVRDPGNLGTIFRTAAAAGYSLILNNCADPYSAKSIQSSMSAILSVDFKEGDQEYLAELKAQSYFVYAADLDGQNLFAAQKPNKICIIIGNEANGISKEIAALAHKTVTIPMKKGESLNAAISAAIAMYYFKN